MAKTTISQGLRCNITVSFTAFISPASFQHEVRLKTSCEGIIGLPGLKLLVVRAQSIAATKVGLVLRVVSWVRNPWQRLVP